MKVSELFDKYGSDKNERNGYGHAYDELLTPRKKSVKAVLEIGVFHGASLRAWRDFFPNAVVYGFDVHPSFMLVEDRIQTCLVDSTQADEVDLRMVRLNGIQFDLIVDDGSHILRHQLLTLANLWRYVKPGGLYVVEDILDQKSLESLSFIGNATVTDKRWETGVEGAVMMAIRKEQK